jgi:hypothetical protein
MYINQTAFNQILESIKPFKVHLDWFNGEGYFQSDEREILTGKTCVFVNISVHESGTIDAGDYFSPPSFRSNGLSIYIYDPFIFSEEKDEDLVLTSEQEEALIKKMESLILIEN